VFVRLFVLTATKKDFLTMFRELAFLEKKNTRIAEAPQSAVLSK
jgi:hypothetical protein